MRVTSSPSQASPNGPQPKTDNSFYAPGWHAKHKTPVIDGQFIDPKTGDVRFAHQHEEYFGPPCVDILIHNVYVETIDCALRAPRAYPFEIVLGNIMRVVGLRKLKLDSLVATDYTIRVTLSHELTKEEFYEVAKDMVYIIDGPVVHSHDEAPKANMALDQAIKENTDASLKQRGCDGI